MLVKIKTRKKPSYRQLLEYILNDKERLYDPSGKSFLIVHNLKGDSVDLWEKQFLQNMKYRAVKRKDSILLYHEILSWHPEEKNISLEKMEELAREYISRRNPSGMYVAVPHFDKHYHVHICASAWEYHNGRSLRLDKAALQKLRQDVQKRELELYPELTRSAVRHGSGTGRVFSDKQWQVKNRLGRESDKEVLIEKLNACLSKAKSMDGFLKLLKGNEMRPYERNGRFTGVWYEGRKFRFKRLGVDLGRLSKGMEREAELRGLRGNKSRRKINREIER